MMLTDCDDCYGTGKVEKAPELVELDKRSVRYAEAVTRIMNLSPGRTREEAEAIFDKEFDKLKDEPNGSANGNGSAEPRAATSETPAGDSLPQGGGVDPLREQCAPAPGQPDQAACG